LPQTLHNLAAKLPAMRESDDFGMASARKKAIFRFLPHAARNLDPRRESAWAPDPPDSAYAASHWTAGYLDLESLAVPEPSSQEQSPGEKPATVPFLDLAGKLAGAPLSALKWICFVREFNLSDRHDPERLLRKSFLTRPRGSGLWLRLDLADGDVLEGLATNDLSLLHPAGLLLTPPDTRGNTQRVFVPRACLRSLHVLAVIGPPGRTRKPAEEGVAALQEDLFRPEPGATPAEEAGPLRSRPAPPQSGGG
jgi:hypothetical protein